jgi:hypothetical protein
MIQGVDTDIFESESALKIAKASFNDVGFVGVQNAAAAVVAKKLQDESHGLLDTVKRAARDDAQLRYSAGIASLGPKALAFLQGEVLSNSLFALTGERFVLTQDMSCITVYKAGDQLGVHLDQPPERCTVTCILYLACGSAAPHASDTGLQLKIYGDDKDSINRPPRAVIRTSPGLIVFGRGSRVWHERPQLRSQEYVMALTTCFGAV